MSKLYNRNKILKRYHHQCIYCGKKEHLTIDHVIPHSRAREMGISLRALKNNEGNLVPACRECNHAKGDMTAAEYLSKKELKIFLKKARYLSDTVRHLLQAK